MNENTEQTNRILYLAGDIEHCNIGQICKQILDIQNEDRIGAEKYKKWEYKPIQLHIESFGGSIYDMWALIDIIETSPTPIITYCSGCCMSAAALIFIAGHIRCMYEHSSIMFHQLSSWAFGKYGDLKVEQEQIDHLHEQMVDYIKKHTGLKKKFFKKFGELKQDVYLTSDKCLKFNVCDDIVSPSNIREQLLENIKAFEDAACECACEPDE